MDRNNVELDDFEVSSSTKTFGDGASLDLNMNESSSNETSSKFPTSNVKNVADSWAKLTESTFELIPRKIKPTKKRTSWNPSLNIPGKPCNQCDFVAKKNCHLKSHYFNRHMTPTVGHSFLIFLTLCNRV